MIPSPRTLPGSDTVTFGQLGQGQIKSGLRFGSVASAGTKAGVSRVRAVHRNQQQAVAALAVERVFNPFQKVAVLQCQRGQITATYPDHRSSTGHDGGFMKAQAAIGLQLRAPECFLRGKRQRFYCLRAVGPAEAAWGITLLQSIMPGCLLLGNPSRQLINVLCWSEQNSAIAHPVAQGFQNPAATGDPTGIEVDDGGESLPVPFCRRCRGYPFNVRHKGR